MDWQAFFAMGGYAIYVWPAYGIVLIVLAANAAIPRRREQQLRARAAQRARNGSMRR